MVLKYTTGESQIIPRAVLKAVRYQHVITYYIKLCKKHLFNHLSEGTLYQILKGLKPPQKKSLATLVEITAEGLNRFSILENIVAIHGKE